MLTTSCPDLEELCLDGLGSWPTTEPLPLLQARWPKLHKLTLGDIIVDLGAVHGINSLDDQEKHPFIEFLAAHPKLDSLRTSRFALSPTGLSALDEEALPELKEFSGTLEQLQILRRHHTSLTSVGFHEPMMMRDITPLAVSAVLQGIPNLTTLRISFVLHSMYESGSLLRSLAGCCPRLERLELVCGHKPSFPVESFSKAITHLPRLRMFDLSTVHFPGDASLADNAVLLARLNPRLHAFTITHLPAHTAVPTLPSLPFSTNTTSSFSSTTSGQYAQMHSGTFTIVPDEHGLPVYLYAVERRTSWWGLFWPIGVVLRLCCGTYKGTVKRYRVDLRPGYLRRSARRRASVSLGKEPGVVGVAGRDWGEWLSDLMGLLGERSAAGEELRVVVFLGMLFMLALWGFLFFGVKKSVQARRSMGAEFIY